METAEPAQQIGSRSAAGRQSTVHAPMNAVMTFIVVSLKPVGLYTFAYIRHGKAMHTAPWEHAGGTGAGRPGQLLRVRARHTQLSSQGLSTYGSKILLTWPVRDAAHQPHNRREEGLQQGEWEEHRVM